MLKQFPPYYGIFPYIIMRLAPAIYMQIPIHFIPDDEQWDPVVCRGAHLFNVPLEFFDLSRDERILKEHQGLIDLTRWCKKKVESENKFFQWCLVETSDRCYYFDNDAINESDRIPTGGTLLTQTNEVIAMNRAHYIIEDDE